MSPNLAVDPVDVRKRFGALPALAELSLCVYKRDIYGLLTRPPHRTRLAVDENLRSFASLYDRRGADCGIDESLGAVDLLDRRRGALPGTRCAGRHDRRLEPRHGRGHPLIRREVA